MDRENHTEAEKGAVAGNLSKGGARTVLRVWEAAKRPVGRRGTQERRRGGGERGCRARESESAGSPAGPERRRTVLDTALLALGTLNMPPSSCIGATLIIQAARVSGLGGRWLDSGLNLKVLLIALVMERNHK